MNKRIIIAFLAFTAILVSCKKSAPVIIDMPDYYITASKNNADWSAVPYAKVDQDSLLIQGQGKEELLSMKIKFSNLGNYTLTGGQCFYWLTLGGDAIIAQYQLRTDIVSSINITSYDPVNKIVEGTFNLKLVQTYPPLANPILVRLNFSNGKFRSQIK